MNTCHCPTTQPIQVALVAPGMSFSYSAQDQTWPPVNTPYSSAVWTASQFKPVGRLWASYISGCLSIWVARCSLWLESEYASLAERLQSAARFSVCSSGEG